VALAYRQTWLAAAPVTVAIGVASVLTVPGAPGSATPMAQSTAPPAREGG
jgi:hypothetical protein